ncbi:MAG: glucokinase [Thermodesulfobacteriota bacterium]|nr:glucokinase [Thermodesulfobacteriota bacterium]
MKNMDKQSIILAGDIGGTKTDLGLFTPGKRRPHLKVIQTYPSKESPKLEDILEHFLEKHPFSIGRACFGIAGPVVNGRCKTTNLPWEVSEDRLKKFFKWEEVRLINDLTATAFGIPLLSSRELAALNKIRRKKGENLGLIAPGTGLGKALIICRENRFIPVSSEGGHVDFAPNNEEEVQLWRYLHRRFGHVSTERVLSGPGLWNIYSWMKDSGLYPEAPWLAEKIRSTDPAKAITEAAIHEKDPLALSALDMFVSILGAVAGNLALTGMTTGGIYLGGGIPPKILPVLKEGPFMKVFAHKGRFKGFLETIPVRVVLNERTALMGAACCALEGIHG